MAYLEEIENNEKIFLMCKLKKKRWYNLSVKKSALIIVGKKCFSVQKKSAVIKTKILVTLQIYSLSADYSFHKLSHFLPTFIFTGIFTGNLLGEWF